MKTLAIIILNWNGWKETIDCLTSLNKVAVPTDYQLQIIVVDNGSTDESVVKLKEFIDSSPIKLIETNKNLGYAGGNNAGIRFALKEGADAVIVLNNDTEVDNEFISYLLKPLESNSHIGIISPKIYFAKGFEYHKDRYDKKDLGKVIWYAGGIMDWKNVLGSHRGVDQIDTGQFDQESEIDYASGCCILITKAVFEKIGFFNEKYFLYYEDNDFCEKAKKAGFKIVFAPQSIIWHKNAASAGGSGSNLQDYYITRNRLVFGMQYAPLRSKVALIKEAVRLLQKGRPWQKVGVSDFFTNKLGIGSYSSK